MARASQRPARSASVAALLCPIVVAACGSSSSGPTFTTEDAGLDASTTNSSDGATEQNIAPPDAARESSPSIDSAGADTASVAHQDGGSQINQDASNGANPDAGPSDAATQDAPTGDAANTTIPMEVTFYGWADNSPPGNAIAYPANGGQPTIHNAAGGTGTYADPITFATAPTEFSPGTRLYVPFIEKYVVMEDSCGQCTTDW